MEDHRPHAESDCTAARAGLWWWLRQLLLTGIASFFVCFGISVLISAYRLNDPFSFIMTFFCRQPDDFNQPGDGDRICASHVAGDTVCPVPERKR
jgi:hypothetical protein